jgi:hypothetical protein
MEQGAQSKKLKDVMQSLMPSRKHEREKTRKKRGWGAFVVNDFDLVSGILERERVKQPPITKTPFEYAPFGCAQGLRQDRRGLPALFLAGYETAKEDFLTPAPSRSLESQRNAEKNKEAEEVFIDFTIKKL